MLTDNPELVGNVRELPALLCVQRAATKKIVTEEDLMRSNIASFGSDVGKVTNWVTSMYDVQAQFEPGSHEYEVLEYRIQCGELYQQNSIDKTKGIVCKPMPRYWHDRLAIQKMEEGGEMSEDDCEFNRKIVADKKPYFMRYIYPALMKEYNTYIKNTNMKSLCEFRVSVDELTCLAEDDRNDDQNTFVYYYYRRMPVGINNCVMNRLCKKVEAAFDSKVILEEHAFDYSIMKAGAEYTDAQYSAIEKLYREHNEKMQELTARRKSQAANTDSLLDYVVYIGNYFKNKARCICNSDEQLCDIVLDMCYKKAGTKQFAWDIASEFIIHNLLKKHDGVMTFPIIDPDGDFDYQGNTYSMAAMEVDYSDRDRIE